MHDGQAKGEARPFRRKLFYIPGYDPFHPRRYRELYRKEGAAQAALSGYELSLQPKRGGGPYGWQVAARIEDRACLTDMEVLVWTDLVRASMNQSIPATYMQLLRTAWAYVGSGALFRLMRLRKGPILAALYPIAMLLGQLVLALLAGAGLWALAAHLLPGTAVPGALLAVVAVWAVLRWFKRQDSRFFAYYLMHDYAYSAQAGGANPPALEARMAEFRKIITAALVEGFDEVLVVGHSSGAHLAVSILSDLIRAGGAGRGALSLLTLGQVVPMVSFLPEARRLRADLAYLSAREEVAWVDVTAPGDGCAFALCDPVKVSGVAPAGQRWPLIYSAAFSQTLRPETWASLKRRYFRLHFQYLCAFDNLPGTSWDYDYFRITAGPQTLADRFAARPPSKSRIDRAVNRFTTVV